jgi:hypothetical protein
VTVYSVYEPPTGNDDDVAARADRIAFVKEGFSWPAFLVPALWLLYHRMWIELVLFLVIFSVLPAAFGLDRQEAFGWASLGLIALFAFEANDLRGWALKRRGYRLAAIASGRDRYEAERSFFTAWLPQQEAPSRSVPPVKNAPRGHDAPVPSRGGGGDEVIGLFPRA